MLQSPGIAIDDDGPVFAEPWEAKAFAMAVTCHERGLFDWPAWANALGATIQAEPDLPYYKQWLATLERLLADIGTIPEAERLDRTADDRDGEIARLELLKAELDAVFAELV